MGAVQEIKRPALRYHGGKFKMRKEILPYLDVPHTTFCSWFMGAASVEMAKPRVKMEVWNDRWNVVTNLFEVLRDKHLAEQLKEKLRLTPYARAEYAKVKKVDWSKISDPVELARMTVFLSFAGYGSGSSNVNYSTSFRYSSKRSGSGPPTDFSNYLKHIDSFTERLQGVCIENRSYERVCYDHDSNETLHYLDPPYVRGTRTTTGKVYAWEMTDADHAELCDHARQMKGMVVISGYQNKIYDQLLPDWKQVSFKAIADGAKERVEILYINPKAAANQNQLSLNI